MIQNRIFVRRIVACTLLSMGAHSAMGDAAIRAVFAEQPIEQTAAVDVAQQWSGKELSFVEPATKLHRRPIAVVAINDDRAVVANRRSGTLSIVNAESLAVDSEYQLGGHPTDVVRVGTTLLITEKEGRLSSVQVHSGQPSVQWRVAIPNEPATVRVSPQKDWCSVSSTWARKVTFVCLPESIDESPEIVASIDLPFSPREQLILPDQSRLMVADAFGPRIAVIRLDTFEVESIREIPGNNIRGLALGCEGEKVYVAHELINEIAPPRSSEIIWGSMVSDATREISVASIVDPEASLMSGSRFIAVGNNTRGAGDPNAILMRDDNRLMVAIGGLAQVGVVEPSGIGVTRIPTGSRPVAIAEITNDRFLVANEFSDTLTRIDFHSDASAESNSTKVVSGMSQETEQVEYEYDSPKGEPADSEDYDYGSETYRASDDPEAVPVQPVARVASYQIGPDATSNVGALLATATTLSLGLSPELSPSDRGEVLFFDASLSRGGWYSCHSCHTDGHTSGSLADTLSDGGEGAPKRVLSLRGVRQTGPWAWIGDKPEIEKQVRQTLQLTMQGRRMKDRDVSDLVAYLNSLSPTPAFSKPISEADREVVSEGRELFQTLDCVSCHSGDLFTSDATYDVGLSDERGATEFNPPSLRGVGHLHGLFHDLRAADIDAVVNEFRHQLPRELSADERIQLIRYLESL
ncbi:MAG: cytochrome c peroxidase [Rhodopirellula bahusiensis]|uniref:cytochrome c peroxidase n=4 Tax=Rhodopirellula bahusiensis TaxID=2014065 RepID=UPI0032980C71